MGVITGSLDTDSGLRREASDLLAAQIFGADIILATGAFDAEGNKVFNSDNGAWDTDLLLIDLVSADDDILDGGDDRDILFGQRGNDTLRGGTGDDLLFGDNATNTVPYWTEVPQIVHGYRLIGVAANVPITLDTGGSVIVPDVTLETSQFDFADPVLTIVSDVVPSFFAAANNDALRRDDGSLLMPYMATVPDSIHHADALAGNDIIVGQDGADLIFGDDATFRAPLTSQYSEIRDAMEDVTEQLLDVQNRLIHQSQDFDLAEHTIFGIDHPHDILIGNDQIDGGGGDDLIVGDQGLILTQEISLTPDAEDVLQALAVHNWLRDLEHVLVDVNYTLQESHSQISGTLVSDALASNPKQKKSKTIIDLDNHHLFLSNDIIRGGDGNDLITADDAALVVPVIDGTSVEYWYNKDNKDNKNNKDNKDNKDNKNNKGGKDARGNNDDRCKSPPSVDQQLKAQQDDREEELDDHLKLRRQSQQHQLPAKSLIRLIAYRFDVDVSAGNDEVHGGAGDDVIVGDFSIMVLPTLLEPYSGYQHGHHLSSSLDDLVTDISKTLNDHRGQAGRSNHQHHDDWDEHHSGSDGGSDGGNDILFGDAGNDIMLGDNGVILPRLSRRNNVILQSYVVRDQNLFGHSDGGSDGGDDIMSGGDGNDVMLGQGGEDLIMGDDGDDQIYGGGGKDKLSGGAGRDRVNSGSRKLDDEDVEFFFKSSWLDEI